MCVCVCVCALATFTRESIAGTYAWFTPRGAFIICRRRELLIDARAIFASGRDTRTRAALFCRLCEHAGIIEFLLLYAPSALIRRGIAPETLMRAESGGWILFVRWWARLKEGEGDIWGKVLLNELWFIFRRMREVIYIFVYCVDYKFSIYNSPMNMLFLERHLLIECIFYIIS